MPTLWTPEGEYGVPAAPPEPTPAAAATPAPDTPTEEQLAAERAAIERELAAAPAEDVVANHCFGLFQLAALYLTQSPPELAKAKLAIDALGGVVDALGSRLGESTATLQGALAQIRLAFVELSDKAAAPPAAAPAPPGGNGEAGARPTS
jgi:hypothetical protein